MIEILEKAALAGGKVLRNYFNTGIATSQKTDHQNLVTAADLESQKVVHETILQEMKKAGYSEEEVGFIGEENLHSAGKFTFVIDPLDGTANFASGFDYFAVSIGLMIDGVLSYAAIYDPLIGKLYLATPEKGAYKKSDGKEAQMKISETNLKNLLYAGGINSDEEIRKFQFRMYNNLHPHFRGFISVHSTVLSLMYLAESIFGFYYSGKCYIWDVAAAKLIVEKSGGVLVDLEGKEIELNMSDPKQSYSFIACHKDNVKQILDLVDAV